MNKNETLTLWLSIGAAIFAVMLLYSYTQEKSDQIAKKFGAMTSVVTAVRDIGEMETVDDSMVQLKEYPSSFVQPEAILTMEEAIGLVALAPLSKGEQVLRTKITRPGPTTGLSLQVSPTKRALTIPIDETRGVAKLLKPGDRVDVVVALDVRDGARQKKEIKTLMQDVVILATGIKVVNELPRVFEEVSGGSFIRNIRAATDFNSITVEADPRDIQDLVYVLATSPGSLFLSLRHPSDHSINQHLPVSSLDSLLGRSARKPASRKSNSSWIPKLKRR
ncbi:MAG: Flp pilus assembly protein CpaB [Oligoflexia bacterium]|nr:Flp pilus assembly protein CpaB [Oligoflexia bacterium]